MKLLMLQVQMEVVYKVQNMQLIVDNMIHEAVLEEEVEVEDDLHSVVEEDLSVVQVVLIQVTVNHLTTLVHHKWLDVQHLVDHHVILVVQ